ncbi:MAG: SsrA-binding protein [Chitinophagaceae bacterium]|nr:SsrA-binding protein [Chitinophagaceae bacterium]MCO5285977.1 SsrA-binding protein [Chitinophagaceae bacterium]MCZ2397140.1 SsrA-binding protein [Chitinophagales bacterium]
MDISNRKAHFEYSIIQKYTAGIVLTGTEIKSVRLGKASFNDSYCLFFKGELILRNLHIAEYGFGGVYNHEPTRERKLLLRKAELRKLESKIKEKGYTIVPLKLFLSEKGLAKVEIGLGKGKKTFDKRETIKSRESEREIRRKFGV